MLQRVVNGLVIRVCFPQTLPSRQHFSDVEGNEFRVFGGNSPIPAALFNDGKSCRIRDEQLGDVLKVTGFPQLLRFLGQMQWQKKAMALKFKSEPSAF